MAETKELWELGLEEAHDAYGGKIPIGNLKDFVRLQKEISSLAGARIGHAAGWNACIDKVRLLNPNVVIEEVTL